MKKGILLESREILFSGEVEQRLGAVIAPEVLTKAKENSKKVSVFKILYKSGGHKVSGFVVMPKSAGPFPCIIYNRGGNRNFFPLKLGHLFLALADIANWGYVVIASQYSGSSESEGVDQFGGNEIKDVLNLKKILGNFSQADIGSIGMYGGSRGGMMTYLSLSKVRWIRAAVTISGLANLVREAKLRPEMKKVFKECFGGSVIEMKKRSAVYFAKNFSKKTPLLLMHGSADWRVSPLDSLDLSIELYKNKIPHRLVLFEGGDHFLSEYRKERMDFAREWFDRYLKNKNSFPNLSPHGK